MIRYVKLEKRFPEISAWEKNSWIIVNAPRQHEIHHLIKKFGLPRDFMEDILDPDERARTERSGEWSMNIVRVPIYTPVNQVPYATVTMGVLLSPHTVITICRENERISKRILSLTQFTPELLLPHNFLLNLMHHTAQKYLAYLKRINIQANRIEDELQLSTKNEELRKLLRMEKCLVYFLASMKSNELLLHKLRSTQFVDHSLLDQELLEDVRIEMQQAIEMAKIYSEVQNNMMQAFSNVISNNLNNVMKQLTSITIILMIPTLIASFYGMNTVNFLEESKLGFVTIIFVSILITVLGFWWFRRKNLF
ncbi:magnesium transporter CorA family protein [Prolixibacteraceae bacterium JC049]|nr:magnesium transporter CorA family protein [Prolixibacteraceae bacterium JC049]